MKKYIISLGAQVTIFEGDDFIEVEAEDAEAAIEKAKDQFRTDLDAKHGWVDYDDAIVNSITEV